MNVVNVFYNFQVDNDPPDIETSINHTFPTTNGIINISANATDIIAVSTIIIGHNNSGIWVNVSNTTVSDDTTNDISLDFLLTVTASQGETIGVMACANDTFNQFSCGTVLTMQVNDTTVPTIVTGNNATRLLAGQNINFTYNVTDNFLLDAGQIIVTNNSIKTFFNFSLGGTSNEFSFIFNLSGDARQTINVTGIVNDTFGNSARVETIFSMTKDLVVNATNSYDNTTILSFSATLFNSTFSETQIATEGNVSFNDVISGIYTIDISSDENGGYHNLSRTFNAENDFEARLHQAIVYFTAVRRGTADAILDYNLSVTLAENQSNSTGGLRFLLNASKYRTSGISSGFFDFPINISLGNQSTSRAVAEFYNINVSISIFSVVNNTFLHNFTIVLDGTGFTETQIDRVGAEEGNLTFSLGNGTYNIEVSHPEFSTSFFSFGLIDNETLPNLTFSILGLNSINFSVFDEITELLITDNATINIISEGFVGNFTADDGVLYLQNLIAGDYRITYSARLYRERDFFVTVLNNSNQSVDLYLLSITNGTDVTFTVQDNSGNELVNATIRLKRYYLSSNSYRTVAMTQTNQEGKGLIDVDFNDAYYDTLTTVEGFSLRTIGARIITTTMILTMSLIPDPLEDVDTLNNIDTSLTFNNITETFSYVFTDLTGASRTGTLVVIEITPTSETILCTTTDTSSSATLLCQVNTTNITGSFVAKGSIRVSGVDIMTDRFDRLIGTLKLTFRDIAGNQGIFISILVAGTLGGMGAIVSPAVGIIMFLVGLGITSFFGFNIILIPLLVTFIILGAVIIYKMKSR